jgi:two-component system LytT family response regulator
METTRLRALIVDDEEYARKNMVMMIDEFCPEIEVIGEASGKEQALSLFS